MENTKRIGNLTELQVITKLYELGCAVSIPFGNSEKYDLIIDYKNKLYKIQVKHANLRLLEDGSPDYVDIACYWQGNNSKGYKLHKYTQDEVDLFATFYNNVCYLIPLKECSTHKVLRISPPKNCQLEGVSMIEEYEALKTLERI